MRYFIYCFLISLFLISAPNDAKSQSGDFGLGIILGEPTGISAKVNMGSSAFVGGVAWSFAGRNSRLHMHLDYVFQNFDLINVDKGKMGFYYGIGGRILMRENADNLIGVRFPVGLNYFFESNPFELFIEIAPIFDLAPKTDFSGNSGFGFRYYF
jgi:hypothetical protein